MNIGIRIVVLIAGLIVFAGVFQSLINRKINEAISFLWMIIGLAALFAGIFPTLVERFAYTIGMEPPSLVFIFAIILLLLIVYNNTSRIAMQDAKIRELSIQLSILKSDRDNEENGVDE